MQQQNDEENRSIKATEKKLNEFHRTCKRNCPNKDSSSSTQQRQVWSMNTTLIDGNSIIKFN